MKKKIISTILSLTFMVLLFQGIIQGVIPASERAALIAFYNSTNGDLWNHKNGWKTPPLYSDGFALPGSENTWAGIGIAGDHVISIYFTFNNLKGPIPPAIKDLERLEELTLESNVMNGTIIPELGNLSYLKTLNLDHTWSSGSIPPTLGNLSNLETLIISGNQLTGNIPPELGNLSKLKTLSLGQNQLSSSIPPQLGNLSYLEYLSLSENQLTGNIPPELGNLTNLKIIGLVMNKLSGSIPPQLGNLINIKDLSLWENQLSGNVPTELGNLSNLENLNLSNNQLSGSLPAGLGNLHKLTSFSAFENQLTGSIPPEIGNLTVLGYLNLDDNKISSIPSEIGNLKSLYSLHLGNNAISSLPAGIGNMTNLRDLILNNNRISKLPPEIVNLGNLRTLILSDNDFSGNFPNEICELKLATLDLSNNRLSGNIPTWVYKVPTGLYLSYNEFSGSIPLELGGAYSLYLDHNRLSGPIPNELTNAEILYLNSNQLSGSLPPGFLDWNRFSEKELDIRYNSLYTDDKALSDKVNMFCYQWYNTQTIAPVNVKAVAVSSTAITISWPPILYTADTGGYLVYYGVSAKGPWIYSGKTADKNATSYTITGLSPAKRYYFFVRTRTDAHSENENVVTSATSTLISAVTKSSSINYTLTVQSSPDIAVPITATPVDMNNKGSGTTPFNRSYNNGTVVTLTAPTAFNGKEFSKWVIGGIQSTNLSATVTMGSNQTAIAYYITPVQPVITLNRDHFYFGVKLPATQELQTGAQFFSISNSGGSTLHWSAVPSENWLLVEPGSGIGNAEVQVSVNAANLSAGTYTGSITIADLAAANSPRTVMITLKVFQDTTPPFGSFDTPLDGAVVQGSIPVTGWAMDDIGIDNVKIYREENNSHIYIGDAIFVEGARTDIEIAYPEYPNNYNAGWGYMLLTNYFPDGGNGTYTLIAKATDLEGNVVILGTKTITIDNAHAVKPFGTIDTPTQGGTASGKNFVNFGWALTPQPNSIPVDGSTINVIIDGVVKGHPVYNIFRTDVAKLFPGYNNSNGAVGYNYIDTTRLANGIHTIAWTVRDNAGSSDGIGSRYFSVMNTGASDVSSVLSDIHLLPYDETSEGILNLEPAEELYFGIKELERVEINLSIADVLAGYVVVGDQLRELPIGSTLDKESGIFYWQPGPGFLGEYRFTFIGNNGDRIIRKTIVINIKSIPPYLPPN